MEPAGSSMSSRSSRKAQVRRGTRSRTLRLPRLASGSRLRLPSHSRLPPPSRRSARRTGPSLPGRVETSSRTKSIGSRWARAVRRPLRSVIRSWPLSTSSRRRVIGMAGAAAVSSGSGSERPSAAISFTSRVKPSLPLLSICRWAQGASSRRRSITRFRCSSWRRPMSPSRRRKLIRESPFRSTSATSSRSKARVKGLNRMRWIRSSRFSC